MKKLTSLFLAMVMIFALIPSVFAEGGDGEVTKYVYNFKANSEDFGVVVVDTKNEDGTYKFGSYSTNNEYTRSRWHFHEINDTAKNSSKYKDNGNGSFSTAGLRLNDANGSLVALIIKVPEAGTYTVDYTIQVNSDYSSQGGLFIFPTGTELSTIESGTMATSEHIYAQTDHTDTAGAEGKFKSYTSEKKLVVDKNDQEFILVWKKMGGKNKATDLTNITLTKAEESPEYVSAFTPSDTVEGSIPAKADVLPLAYATDGENIAPANIKATDNENGTYTVTTDAEVNGYTFRYWAKGLESKDRKRIVSFVNEFTYTPSNENNYLIAVYDKAGTTPATTEYYNANGQRIAWKEGDPMPYMAGYGEASGWKEAIYGIKEAIYGEPIKYDITIGDAEPVKFAWGEPVPCVAEKRDGYVFWGWKKTVNNVDAGIVSTDANYTFYAWEDCNITPVYKEAAPVFGGEKRRIILGTFTLGGKNAVMAEFFGFDEALERGITISGTDYAMTNKNADQFTIVDDDNKGNISGYAILADGTKLIYNLK